MPGTQTLEVQSYLIFGEQNLAVKAGGLVLKPCLQSSPANFFVAGLTRNGSGMLNSWVLDLLIGDSE